MYKIKFSDEEVKAFNFGNEDLPIWINKFIIFHEFEIIENKKPYLYKGKEIGVIKNKYGTEVAEHGDWVVLEIDGTLTTYRPSVFENYFDME